MSAPDHQGPAPTRVGGSTSADRVATWGRRPRSPPASRRRSGRRDAARAPMTRRWVT